MTIKEAKIFLAKARETHRCTRKEIKTLSQFLLAAGHNPTPRKKDLTPRNKEMYKLWADGKTFKEIAKEIKLSTTTVSTICHRIDRVLEKKLPAFNKYKDLLPYKRDI